jgi:hypothetical protein
MITKSNPTDSGQSVVKSCIWGLVDTGGGVKRDHHFGVGCCIVMETNPMYIMANGGVPLYERLMLEVTCQVLSAWIRS